ncbi:MAG: hypothetical protein ACRYE9_00245 [Janthinobacterium lividum]
MKEKPITFVKTSLLVGCLLFNAQITASSSDSPPTLPSPEITINSPYAGAKQKKTDDSISFINKIKKIFGFKQSTLLKKKDNKENKFSDEPLDKRLSGEAGNHDDDEDENESFIDTKHIKIPRIDHVDSINTDEIPKELKSTKTSESSDNKAKNTALVEDSANTSIKKIDSPQNISTANTDSLAENSTKNDQINSSQETSALAHSKPIATSLKINEPSPKDQDQSTISEINSLLKEVSGNKVTEPQVPSVTVTHQEAQQRLISKIIVKDQTNKSKSKNSNNKSNLSNNNLDHVAANKAKQKPKNVRNSIKSTHNQPVVTSYIHDSNSDKLSDQQNKFVVDEAKVLLLPDEDIVLGQITESAKIDLMDLSSYIKLLELDKDQQKRQHQKEIINNFIATYDKNFGMDAISLSEAVTEAFDAIEKDNLSQLRVLIDNYPLLRVVDEDGDTLIQNAIYLDNYFLTKFLIMRGVNLSSLDYQKYSSPEISQLLERAGVK